MGKLKASTLIEVMVAMVLIAIAVGVGSIIFMNIAQHSNNVILYKAQSIIEQNEQKNIKKYATSETEIFRDDNLIITQNLSVINETNNFVLVVYIAKDAKRKMVLKHKKMQRLE